MYQKNFYETPPSGECMAGSSLSGLGMSSTRTPTRPRTCGRRDEWRWVFLGVLMASRVFYWFL